MSYVAGGQCVCRGISVLMALLLLILVLPGSAMAQTFAGGNGTAQNPYLVSTVQQLQAIKNGQFNTSSFRLTNNIDASATSGWNNGQGFDPIGWFGGVLDGNGFTISGLTINRQGSNDVALFTQLGAEGLIKNLTLHNISIVGGIRAAALVATLAGTIENVTVSGTVSGERNSGGLVGQNNSGGSIIGSHANVNVSGSSYNIGGLVGYNNSGFIYGSNSSGRVEGQTTVGGLVGKNDGLIDFCNSESIVIGTGDMAGGLVGHNNNGNISNSYATGTVEGNNRIGGVVGYFNNGTINNCHASSTVSGNSDVGGLVGHLNGGTIENTYSTGSVTGDTNIGGLVGFAGYGGAVIKTSFSSSDVNGSNNQAGGLIGRAQGLLIQNTFATGRVAGNNRVGGLIGELLFSATLETSFSTGFVTGNGGQTGGLVGRNNQSSVSNSFWDAQTSGQGDSDGGTSRTTVQMKTQSTFTNAGWNFTNIWSMQPPHNNGYPFLQIFPPVFQDFSWTGATNRAWQNATNWNTNTIPDVGDNVIIPDVPNKPIIRTSVTITGITINSGSSLTIAESGSLTVTGQLTNNAGASGLLVRSSATGTGSFIYNGNVTGSFQRYIGNTETWQLLSSPVSSQPISGDFTPSGTYGDGTGYDFYTWHEPDTAWVYLLNTSQAPTWATANAGSNTFIPGRGYLVSYQQTGTKTFMGSFNHSQVSIPMTKSGDYAFNLENEDYSMFSMNLAGNPYPSSIDWKAQSGWGRSNLEQTGGGYDIWIWSETNKNYGVYNSGSIDDLGTLGTSRYIAPNQGFFVRASGNGNLTINAGVKTHQGSGNWINKSASGFSSGFSSGFNGEFNGGLTGGLSEESPGKIHLRIEDRNGSGSADEVIVEFGHTKYTKTPGSPKLFSMIETAPSLYIPKDKKSYSIRRLNTPDQSPLLPLSFIAGTDGEYAIIAAFDPFDMDMVVLEDLQTSQTHDFKTQGDYTFFATVKDKPARFLIRFKEGNYANPHARLPVNAFSHNKTLSIDLRLVEPGEKCLVELFDSLGRKVFEGSYSGNSLYEVTLDSLQGAFMVQISTRHASYGTKVMIF